MLTAISVLLEVLHRRLIPVSATDAEVASTISRQAQEACAQARMLARGLSPVELETNGLCHALKEMAGHTAALMKVKCEFQGDEPFTIHDSTKATHLYRIAQEAVNNALNHGKATTIIIRITKDEAGAELKITDDGCGFRTESPGPGGMGLRNMKYRAGAIGARLDIHSASMRGTEVLCSFAPALVTCPPCANPDSGDGP